MNRDGRPVASIRPAEPASHKGPGLLQKDSQGSRGPKRTRPRLSRGGAVALASRPGDQLRDNQLSEMVLLMPLETFSGSNQRAVTVLVWVQKAMACLPLGPRSPSLEAREPVKLK